MKKLPLKFYFTTLLLCGFAGLMLAQTLPVRAVTIFKNGRSMIERGGKVATTNGLYESHDLPEALFGTYWIGSAKLKSIATRLDSVRTLKNVFSHPDYLSSLSGQSAKIHLAGAANGYDVYEGKFGQALKISNQNTMRFLTFQTKNGTWITFFQDELRRVEFLEEPKIKQEPDWELKKKVEVTFQNKEAQQDLTMSYLVGGLGWTPIYRLDLTDKNKGKLQLRAEIVNDAEDFGLNPELRLAVGVPNFAFATRLSDMVRLGSGSFQPVDYSSQNMNQNMVNYQVAFDAETYEERVIAVPAGPEPTGNQVEDYYFYSVRVGQLASGSRHQVPIFETGLVPSHIYESTLPDGGPGRLQTYLNNNNRAADRIAVEHFIEFKNTTQYPWTTGAVNLFSGADLQPISQDKLPYTAPGATGRVRIAETPEVKVTQTEGDIKREENVSRFFGRQYDRVTIEGQICVVNYKKEPIPIKIKRKVEGKPLESKGQTWTMAQEAATLRVNSEYQVEWAFTLQPGEERKWTYQYEVLVDF